MKKVILAVAAFAASLFAVPQAQAQFTLVSGTVTDPNGLPWACGSISAQLVNNNGVSATLNGVNFSGFTAPVKLGCPTDPSTSRTPGFFQMQLADNTVIKCGIATCGTQTTWLFTVNTIGIAPPQGTGPQSFTQAFTISGSSQTLTFTGVPALSLLTSSSSAPNQNVQYLATACNGQPNCTQVKWNAGSSPGPKSSAPVSTTTNGSNIVTCPDCKFLTGTVGSASPPAVVNQIFFATDSTGQAWGGCLNNPSIQFGGLNQTTIFSVDSDTQLHVVGNAGTTSSGNACISWGDDDTTAINTSWAAGGCNTTQLLPQGMAMISLPIWQKNTGCVYNGGGPYFGQRVVGSNLGSTYVIPTPNFNFTSIAGGQGTAVSCTTCTAAIGNYLIFEYKDVGIFGLGERCSTLASTDLILAGTAARLTNINGVGWCGQGGGNTLIGFHFLGGEDLWTQGGSNFFGSIEAAVDAAQVTFSANFITGMTSNTAGVGKCLLLVGNFQDGASVYTVNNITQGCTQLGNSGGTTSGNLVSMNSQIWGNPNGTADGAAVFIGKNSTLNLTSNDQTCVKTCGVGETAVNFFSTGATVRASYSAFAANGGVSVITGTAGNTFKDEHDNTFTGGSGVWNGLGNWLGDGSPTTPVPTISSGFGTSPAILKTSGATSFTVNVGTGGTATAGVIGLSSARNGWTCQVYNQTAHAGNRADDTVQTANTTTTVTFQNQTKSTGAAVAWTASDTLNVSCRAN